MKTQVKHSSAVSRLPTLALAAWAFLGASHSLTVRAADAADTVYIPVIINLYSNCNTTPAEAAEAVKAASKILEQAGLKLVVVKTNDPPGAGNGDDGDGKLTEAEGNKVQDFGGQELTNSASGKGIKISFVLTPRTVRTSSPGWSRHRNPTIVVKNRGNSTNTSETIAHEIGHVMTLCGTNLIGGTNYADGGHAPDVPGPNGRGNLMAPSDYRNGTHLSTNQINEIRSNRWARGLCAKQFTNAFPAQSEQIQFASMIDPRGDGNGIGPDYEDITAVCLTSVADTSDLHCEIRVNAALTNDQFIDVTYTLGFDTDANSFTGTFHASHPGIDRVVTMQAFGNPAAGTLVWTGDVVDTGSNIHTPVPNPPYTSIELFTEDLDVPGVPDATTIICDVPKSLLNLTATLVPVVATAGQFSQVFDTADLTFDSIRWTRDPVLQTFGNGVPMPGSPYAFNISGMTPFAPFRLYLDDTVVRTGTLGNAGNFNGTFVFPSKVSNTSPHFLYARDNSQTFAYSLTCPLVTPSPTMGIEISGDSVLLSFTVPNGYSYVVERSPTLRPALWTSWYADGGTGWPIHLTDTRTPAAQFYRVRVSPPSGQ